MGQIKHLGTEHLSVGPQKEEVLGELLIYNKGE